MYWRDTSAGMSVLPYYFAKFVIDFPRVILGATAYFLALIMFFPYAQSWTSFYSVILMMHFYSFAVGYAVSNTVPYPKFALYCIVFSLLWSMMLTGVSPSIEAVPSGFKWIWDLSVRFIGHLILFSSFDIMNSFRFLDTWWRPFT